MLRVAQVADLQVCLELLAKFGIKKNYTSEDLYLDNNDYGFTVLIEHEGQTIGISTFSKRDKRIEGDLKKTLYWENLFVDSSYRDGFVYIQILAFLRKQLKINVIDDIYFVVRKKLALKTHRAAGFKNFGYICLFFRNICLNSTKNTTKNFEIINYSNLYRKLDDPDFQSGFNQIMNNYTFSSNILKRQIKGKQGYVVWDKNKNQAQFIRTIYKCAFFEINISLRDGNFDLLNYLNHIDQPLLSVNFELSKKDEVRISNFFTRAIFVYELLSFKGRISLDNFSFLEHDAW